jgi:predicted RNase H-like nuclease (RuvC/YqgF family)
MADILTIAASVVGGGSLLSLGGIVLSNRLSHRTTEQSADAAEESAEAAHVQSLIAMLGTYRTELQDAKAQRDEFGRDVAQLRGSLDAQAATERAVAVEHEHQMQRIHATVSALRTEVDNNAMTMATQQQAHARELLSRDAQIAELRQGVADRDRRIDALRSEVAQLRQRVESGSARLQGETA